MELNLSATILNVGMLPLHKIFLACQVGVLEVTESERPRQDSKYPLVERFNQEGWRLERALLDHVRIADVRKFLEDRVQHLHGLFESWVEAPTAGHQSYAWHQEQVAAYQDRGLPRDLFLYLRGEFDLETRLDPMIKDILSTDRCKKFICSFLGADRYLVHYPPMIRFKLPAAPGSVVPVHQDVAYNRHLSKFITIWMPFVEVDEECGGLIVYEGSQLGDEAEHMPSGPWSNKADADLSKYRARHILMSAGDGLVFPPTLFHESAPHRSSVIRLSIDFRVFSSESDTTQSYYDPFTRVVTRQH